jgi:hypothetical protein
MATPGAGSIFGELEGIANDASGFQQVSDNQAAIMQSLSQTCEGLVPSLQGAAGTAMQQVGERLHTLGMQFAAQFADQSHMMSNNASLLSSRDEESSSHILSQVSNLT